MILPVIFAAMMSCVLVLWGVFLMWPEIENLFIEKKDPISPPSFDPTIFAPTPPPASFPAPRSKPEGPDEQRSPSKKPDATPSKKPDATPSKKPDVTPSKKPDATPPKKPDQPITPPKKPDQPIVASGVLEFHNQVRARHDAGPLVWSGAVAASAQAWANTCTWGHPGGHP